MPHAYCCVDVEASGPVPGLHDLVSIGAVAVLAGEDGRHVVRDDRPFYAELLPQGGQVVPEAMAVHGLTTAHLVANGVERRSAVERLTDWARSMRRAPEQRLVFVGHNAPFDWAWINHAYHAEGLPNPFGWKALDSKALAMGVLDLDWFDTNKERLAELLPGLGDQDADLVHRADYDAAYQGRILAALLDRPGRSRNGER